MSQRKLHKNPLSKNISFEKSTERDENMKVIVFSGSGFLGSHVADALTGSGYEVIVYDLRESPYLRGSQKTVVGELIETKGIRNASSKQFFKL